METEEILAAIQKAATTIATPNWMDILSAAISLLAILIAAGVAIYVAQKQNEIAEKQTEIALKQAEIAEQQNKITLFEKRYEVYVVLVKIIDSAKEILKIDEIDKVHDIFSRDYKEWQWPSKREEHFGNSWFSAFKRMENTMGQAEFLFSEEIYDAIFHLRRKWGFLVASIYLFPEETINYFNGFKLDFCTSATIFNSKKILAKIRMDLQLQSIKL